MHYTRQEHSNFLENELRAQTNAFNQKLNTSAAFLLKEKEELFVAQFITFREGEMILKFSNNRALPRKGEYLYCFTVPKELRDYSNWGNKTYGDLIKEKSNFTEAVCVWQAHSKDKNGQIEKDFSLVGFRGIDIEFSSNLLYAEKIILLLGPNKPPFEYIANLQKIVLSNFSDHVNSIIDQEFQYIDNQPLLIDNKFAIPSFILAQLVHKNQLIIIGPPGTGKTFQIAEICKVLCEQGKSVLVTALTNRALIEVVEKPALADLMKAHKIFKTNLSADEANDLPHLQQLKEIIPLPGRLILSTFYTASDYATNLKFDAPFDFIIVDEASQALLAMFGAAKILGEKNIWIGDPKQLPPIVAIPEDKINKYNFHFLVDGLKTLSTLASIQCYQLTETYRLPKRAADYTGLFYNKSLKSKVQSNIRFSFTELKGNIGKLLHPQGGATLIKTDLEVGNKQPKIVLEIVYDLIFYLSNSNEKLHISVLSNYIETVKSIQKFMYQSIDYSKNLLIETIARIQGLTTDITILVIPNSGYYHSLEKRLFNVATSRAKRHTIIICDKSIFVSYPQMDGDVRNYLQILNNDFSFYIKTESYSRTKEIQSGQAFTNS